MNHVSGIGLTVTKRQQIIDITPYIVIYNIMLINTKNINSLYFTPQL